MRFGGNDAAPARQTRQRQRARWPMLAAGLAAVIAATLNLGSAWAHAQLARSEPAANAVLGSGPSEVRVWFTEQPELKFSELTVTNAQNERVDLRDTHPLPGESMALAVSLDVLPEGVYTVGWKTLSSVDGHEARGFFAFAVGQAAAAALPTLDDSNIRTVTGQYEPSPVAMVVRWVSFVAGAMLLGALWLHALVMLPAVSERPKGVADDAAPWRAAGGAARTTLVNLAGWGLVGSVVAAIALLFVQAAAGAGTAEVGAVLAAAETMLVATRFGVLLQLRLLLLVIVAFALWAAVIRRPRPRPASAGGRSGRSLGLVARGASGASSTAINLFWPFILTVSAWAMLTVSLNSHGAAAAELARFATLADWLHLLAASIWTGGLFGLAATLPGTLAPLDSPGRALLLRGAVRRFSMLAAGCVTVLAATGTFAAWLQIGTLDALFGSDYGRVLLVKLAGVACMLALATFHRLWLQPALDGLQREKVAERLAAGAEWLRRRFAHSLRAEWLAGAAVLAATAVLVNLSPPSSSVSGVVAAPPAGVSANLTANDSRVAFRLLPAVIGLNSFDLQFTDRSGRPLTDVTQATLRLKPLDSDLGESEVRTEPFHDDPGRFVAIGSSGISAAGRWELRIIAQRQGQDDIDRTFLLTIGQAGPYTLTLTTQPNPPKLGRDRLDLFIADATGEPAVDVSLESQVLMPAHAHEADVDWRPLGNGHFATDADLTMDGRWLSLVTITPRGGAPVDAELRFDVPLQ